MSVPYFDRQGVHEIYRKWRKLFNSYGDVMAVAEAWVHPPENAVRYVRPDELNQVFNFELLTAPFESASLFDVINRSLELYATVGGLPTWALSNHDCPRVASRLGEWESRALAIFVFALPGATYIFAGQELGLPDGELADADRQDPSFVRSHGVIKGRDGARVPLPWNGQETPFGFSTGKPWLPINQQWEGFTIENENKDPKSVLNLYRRALTLRAEYLSGAGDITWLESPSHGGRRDGLMVFKRGEITVAMNLSRQVQELNLAGRAILLSGGILEGKDGRKLLPPLSCLWLLN